MQPKFLYLLIVLICILFISKFNYSQVSDLKQIPLQYKDVKESAVVAISDNELLFFFINPTQDSLFSIRTTDLGNSWSQQSLIYKFESYQNVTVLKLAAIKTNTNRVILSLVHYSIVTIISDSITILKSDDLGHTWDTPLMINGGTLTNTLSNRIGELVLSKSASNTLYLSFNNRSNHYLWFKKSTDDGETWTDTAKIIYNSNSTISDVSLVTDDDQNLIAVFLEVNSNRILKKNSSDAGDTWSNPETIIEDSLQIKYPRVILTNDNKMWLVYEKEFYCNFPYLMPGVPVTYTSNNIFYRISEDFGNSWHEEKQLTKYIGDDSYLNLTYFNNTPLLSFSTQRFSNYYGLTFLIPNKIEEIRTPPYIVFSSSEIMDSLKDKFVFKAIVIDDESVSKVLIDYADGQLTGELFDDGMHEDESAGDSLYANVFNIPRLNNYDNYLVEENNLKIPVNDHGIIAAVRYRPYSDGYIESKDIYNTSIRKVDSYNLNISGAGGKFDDVVFLFSSGFLMSGLEGNSIWANGAASASLIEDYIPGNVGSDPNDQKNSIYVVKVNDIPFGRSWQSWKDAVERGAEFYDGDNDGIYNPIDKNFNGIWDSDEDMPMILGDETVWCVYNDGVPASMRRLGVPPKDIEIAQTIFTSKESGLENVMFLRYKILNKSNIDYDSVYFGFWADTDLGEAQDDRVGCDTLLRSGVVYNDGPEDPEYGYGDNPPAFFTTMLQGPIIESGSNIDTAYNRLGELLGTKVYSNSRNSNISAHATYIGGDPNLSDPSESIYVRNSLMGKLRNGSFPDPCTFPYGQVLGGVNCNEVNNRLWFSGDPVTQVGWIETISSDVRNLLSTGPFKLKSNEPIDMIAAYVVGRGTDALNSITVTREIVEGVIEEYKNNFPRLTYKPGTPTNPIVSYELYQNYPNPFNPITTIRYAIPQDGIVIIKIFDVLGQQVATLKNEFQKANRYEVKFNSAGLASGVYVYRIQINDYTESKKMILLK